MGEEGCQYKFDRKLLFSRMTRLDIYSHLSHCKYTNISTVCYDTFILPISSGIAHLFGAWVYANVVCYMTLQGKSKYAYRYVSEQ